jgi:tetrahydromethanopterin S-methyltransferase subunit G
MTSPTGIEKQNLEAHVELCAQRYEAIEQRLDAIEGKVSSLQKTIEDGHSSMVKVLIGTAGTVVTGVLSVLVVVLTKMG